MGVGKWVSFPHFLKLKVGGVRFKLRMTSCFAILTQLPVICLQLLSGERRLVTVTVKRLDQLPQTKITSAIWKPDVNEQIVLPYACTGAMTFHLSSSTKPLPKVRVPAHLPHDTDRSGRGCRTSLWCPAGTQLLGMCNGKSPSTLGNKSVAGRCSGETPALPDRLQWLKSRWGGKAGEAHARSSAELGGSCHRNDAQATARVTKA